MHDLTAEIQKLIDRGAKGPFKVVPIVNKRCFIPCPAGYCNCFPTMYKEYAIVSEAAYSRCLKESNKELAYAQAKLDETQKEINSCKI